jgi:hypothetical protein
VLGSTSNSNTLVLSAGIQGVAMSTKNYDEAGVCGTSPWFGVWGNSSSDGTGVVGIAKNIGVFGEADFGLDGETVAGEGASGTATGQGTGVAAYTSPKGYAFVATTLTGQPKMPLMTVFTIDAAGDVMYTGSLMHVAHITGGTSVRSYAPQSAAPTIEDNGSAQLVGGVAGVRLDPTFAATIDPRVSYHVVITPDGDTRGLYVASKMPTGFIVRESQGGPSTVGFDYRIVAVATGQVGVRMAAITQPIGPARNSVSATAALNPGLPRQPEPQAHRPLHSRRRRTIRGLWRCF